MPSVFLLKNGSNESHIYTLKACFSNSSRTFRLSWLTDSKHYSKCCTKSVSGKNSDCMSLYNACYVLYVNLFTGMQTEEQPHLLILDLLAPCSFSGTERNLKRWGWSCKHALDKGERRNINLMNQHVQERGKWPWTSKLCCFLQTLCHFLSLSLISVGLFV